MAVYHCRSLLLPFNKISTFYSIIPLEKVKDDLYYTNMQETFYDIKTVWRSPYRRIFLVWGVIMIVGFLLRYEDLQWFPLSVVGIFTMFYNVPLRAPVVKWIVWMWAAIAGLGTIFSAVEYRSLIPSVIPIYHYGMAWLVFLGVGQIAMGFMMKSRFQQILGVVWVAVGLAFWNTSMDIFLSFYLIAALTGLPYIYIAFKK